MNNQQTLSNINNQPQWPYDSTTAVPGSGRLDAFKTYIAPPGMKNKLDKIADLFEMDVLSEDEALKACKTVIQQHAKVQGKVGKSE